jgi:cysteinyl-tRNA synthetase
MSTKCLGEHFDIHGGGSDLMFPHHENEIAQSEAASGHKFANIWMHNGPLRVDDEKMSKSLGNFFTIREVLKNYDAEVVRYLLVTSHYRSPINYSEQNLKQAASSLERLYSALKDLDISQAKSLVNGQFEKAFYAAMDDDFNTAEGIKVLFDIAREINRRKNDDPDQAAQLGELLVRLGGVLGILQASPGEFLQGSVSSEVDPDYIESLIAERKQAREAKDWARADAIRDELSRLNVVVEDSSDSTTWRIER